MKEEQLDTADWKAIREASQAKRARNAKDSTAILEARGVAFERKNGGVHLIIRHEGRVFDFWPSTGTWRMRSADTKPGLGLNRYPHNANGGRGIFPLLKAMGFEQ